MKKGLDYIGVGVGAIIRDDTGKVLLCKRGKDARNESGAWEFPGGAVEFGDTLAQTIIREIKEELDIEIEIIEQLTAQDHLIPQEKQHWVTTPFFCKILSGTTRIMEPNKCDEVGWFTLKEIETMNLAIPTKIAFDKYFIK